jgi:hypothetical protein
MQMPPQFTRPVGQDTAHVPPLHTRPSVQAFPVLLPAPTLVQSPAAPQWPLSVFGLTQTPPQFTLPVGHETAQAPATQRLPVAQAAPPLLPAPESLQLPAAPQ